MRVAMREGSCGFVYLWNEAGMGCWAHAPELVSPNTSAPKGNERSVRSFSWPLPAARSEKREQAAKAAGNNDALVRVISKLLFLLSG
jgi:hypothetical protein